MAEARENLDDAGYACFVAVAVEKVWAEPGRLFLGESHGARPDDEQGKVA